MSLLALALLVAAAGLPVSPASAAEGDGSNVPVTRYGGADRYTTSLLVAEAFAAGNDSSLDWVVLVSGERWTDAVVAAPLAGTLAAPVLMTPPDELRDDAQAFLQRVGVSKAMVVGPEAGGGTHGPGRGVAAAVIDALGLVGIVTQRVVGADRYGTSRSAAEQYTPGNMGDLGRTAIVASGEVFADALVAGPFAARGNHPVLLTPPGELHSEVAAYLKSAGIEHVVLMGGTSALTQAVETAITGLAVSVTRLAGASRYDTAVQAAEFVTVHYTDANDMPCFAGSTIGLARARVPFDSFGAAPLLARLCAPLVLADPARVPAETAAYIDASRSSHASVDLRVFGGQAAVSQAAIGTYLADNEAAADQSDVGGTTDVDVLPLGSCGGAAGDGPVQLVPSTFAWDPAWSPDCSQLVYSQEGALWTAKNDGTDRKLLVPADGSRRYGAVWSPLGDRIAYVNGYSDGNDWTSHIWTVNADGSDNSQRTSGELIDSWPTWSPDGTRIAFQRITGRGFDAHGNRRNQDRFIVVMTSQGSSLRALSPGHLWEETPAWSPDGSKLAWILDGYLMLSDVDGRNARRAIAGVSWGGGLSWSPDGKRIAFVRGHESDTAIIVTGIDGTDEKVLFDEGIRVRAPRWSPDGQRIAFHTVEDDDRKRRVYVVGAGEDAAASAADCRPRGLRGLTAGFPLPSRAASSTGTLRVAVLFMDFSDAPADYSTQREAESALPRAEEYLESASYGQLDVVFEPYHRWLRAPEPHDAYVEQTAGPSRGISSRASAHAVTLADAAVDFGRTGLVLVVFPSAHFGGGLAGGTVSADGTSAVAVQVNTFHGSSGPLGRWGDTAAHEIIHGLGLTDLYPYGSAHQRAEAPAGHLWVETNWGPMGLRAAFLAAANACSSVGQRRPQSHRHSLISQRGGEPSILTKDEVGG